MTNKKEDYDYGLRDHLASLQQLSEQSTALLRRDGISSDDRSSLAMALYQIVHDSHDSTWTLVNVHMMGPALSLLRMTFEAYVKGYFFHHLANQDEIENVYSNAEFSTLYPYIKRIKKAGLPESEWISEFYHDCKDLLNDAIHGGEIHLRHRIRDGEIMPDYPEELMCGLLQASSKVFVHSVNQLFDLFGDAEGKEQFNNIEFYC